MRDRKELAHRDGWAIEDGCREKGRRERRCVRHREQSIVTGVQRSRTGRGTRRATMCNWCVVEAQVLGLLSCRRWTEQQLGQKFEIWIT